MSANFLINAFLNEDQHIRVDRELCQRVRFRKSNCRRCLEICPENAISLNPGPTINSTCTDCGLCLNACRTEVFQHELHPDRCLLNQARAQLGKYRHQLPGEKKRLLIHCQRAENRNANSLLLPCLGRITATIILGAALSGFDEAGLTKGICSQCRYGQGEKLLADSIGVSRVLLESAGLARFEIRIAEKEQDEGAPLSRREIFSKISDKVRDKAAAFMHRREKAIREKLADSTGSKTGRGHLPQRQMLRGLLAQNRPEKDAMVEYKPDFPWGKIKIEQRQCSGCGTCAALCPTGAVTKKNKNDGLLLFFNAALCVNCDVCRAACPGHAIDFEENFAMADIFAEEATVAAAIQFNTCIICGEKITAQKDNLCHTCRKRQAWPMYVNV